MANRTGEPNPQFRKGDKLLAQDLNRLAAKIPDRVVGAEGVQAGGMGGAVVIRGKQDLRRPAADVVVVEIGAETETPGEYAFTLYAGSGPSEGTCVELNETSGVAEGTRVILKRAGGVWFFQVGGGSTSSWWLVIFVLQDVLACRKLDGDGLPTGDIYYISRAWDLKRSNWDGLTIDGWEYTYVSVQERTAYHAGDDIEMTEVVSPPYIEGESVILVTTTDNGYGANVDDPEEPVMGVDSNNSGRAWAEDF